MVIPKRFTMFGHNISVIVDDIDVDENRYGFFSNATNSIHLFRKINSIQGVIELERCQIENTFLHELIHCLQFFSGYEMCEKQACTFAGLLHEFINTKSDEII